MFVDIKSIVNFAPAITIVNRKFGEVAQLVRARDS